MATIDVSASTNSTSVHVEVYGNDSAVRSIGAPKGSLDVSPRSFSAGSAAVAQFLSDLQRVGDVSTIADDPECAKSVSFGTTTVLHVGSETSPDVQCILDPSAAETALVADCRVLSGGWP